MIWSKRVEEFYEPVSKSLEAVEGAEVYCQS